MWRCLKDLTDPLDSQSNFALPNVFIIDGLDECLDQSEQKDIIHLLASALDINPEWKILVASRPEQIIRTSFDTFVPLNLSTRIALSDEYPSRKDIERFLKDNFAEIKRSHNRKSLISSRLAISQ